MVLSSLSGFFVWVGGAASRRALFELILINWPATKTLSKLWLADAGNPSFGVSLRKYEIDVCIQVPLDCVVGCMAE